MARLVDQSVMDCAKRLLCDDADLMDVGYAEDLAARLQEAWEAFAEERFKIWEAYPTGRARLR